MATVSISFFVFVAAAVAVVANDASPVSEPFSDSFDLMQTTSLLGKHNKQGASREDEVDKDEAIPEAQLKKLRRMDHYRAETRIMAARLAARAHQRSLDPMAPKRILEAHQASLDSKAYAREQHRNLVAREEFETPVVAPQPAEFVAKTTKETKKGNFVHEEADVVEAKPAAAVVEQTQDRETEVPETAEESKKDNLMLEEADDVEANTAAAGVEQAQDPEKEVPQIVEESKKDDLMLEEADDVEANAAAAVVEQTQDQEKDVAKTAKESKKDDLLNEDAGVVDAKSAAAVVEQTQDREKEKHVHHSHKHHKKRH